jgi:hypothetical protein
MQFIEKGTLDSTPAFTRASPLSFGSRCRRLDPVPKFIEVFSPVIGNDVEHQPQSAPPKAFAESICKTS